MEKEIGILVKQGTGRLFINTLAVHSLSGKGNVLFLYKTIPKNRTKEEGWLGRRDLSPLSPSLRSRQFGGWANHKDIAQRKIQ